MLLIDLAGPARHRRVVRRDHRRVAVRHRRPPGGRLRATAQVRQAEARKAEGIIEEEIQHFAVWLGSLEVLPTLAALRAHATEHRRAGRARERRQVGVRLAARPRARRGRRHAIVNRLLHDPTARMREMRDDRVHARMALVRDLFGLNVEEGTSGAQNDGLGAEAASPDREFDEQIAEVRSFQSGARARHPAPLIRIGTRASALALAQARWVAERVGVDAELVDRHDRGRPRRRRADRQVAVGVRARAGAARATRSTSPSTRPRMCRPSSPTGSSWSRSPHAPIRATRSAARRRWRRCRPARGSARAACAAPRSSGPYAMTSRSCRSAATSTRGCASSPPGECDALVLALAGLAAPGTGRRRRRRARRARTRRRPGCAGARRRGPARWPAGRLAADHRCRRDGVRDGRARARARARCIVRHPGRGHMPARWAMGAIELRGWAGLPDGSAWVSDRVCAERPGGLGQAVAERMLAAGAAELLHRRPSGRRGVTVYLVGAGPGDPGSADRAGARADRRRPT